MSAAEKQTGLFWTYGETAIHSRGDEKVNVTDMWRADGSPENKTPRDWLRQDRTKELAEFLNVGQDHISKTGENPLLRFVDTARGATGGTWVHWHLAMDYGRYLSPAFHIWCNNTIRAAMAKAPPPVPSVSRTSPPIKASETKKRELQAAFKRAAGVRRCTVHRLHWWAKKNFGRISVFDIPTDEGVALLADLGLIETFRLDIEGADRSQLPPRRRRRQKPMPGQTNLFDYFLKERAA